MTADGLATPGESAVSPVDDGSAGYTLPEGELSESEIREWSGSLKELDAETLRVLATDLLAVAGESEASSDALLSTVGDTDLDRFVFALAAFNAGLDPLAPGDGGTAMMGGSMVGIGAMTVNPFVFSRSEGGSGNIWALAVSNPFMPPGLHSMEITIDNNPAGITLGDYSPDPPTFILPQFGAANRSFDVIPVTVEAGVYTVRAKVSGPGGEAEDTRPLHVVDTTAVSLEYQKPNGAWAAPDTFLADGSGVPVMWSHDTLRWEADFDGHNPPDVTADFVTLEVVPWDEWTNGLHDPTDEWTTVGPGGPCVDESGSLKCRTLGTPSVGEWAARPVVWFHTLGGQPPAAGVPARMLADPMHVVVAEIESLSWQQSTATGPGLGDLSAGDLVGDRFFPDSAIVGGGNYRLRVDVLIDVAPDNLPLEIHLMNFDVDDPTDADGPVDTDPNPAGDNGVDNRNNTEHLDELSTVVTNMGTVAFYTSVQPGNNFRVAGAGRSTELDPVSALAPDSQSRLFLNTVQQQGQPLVLDLGEPIIDENNPAGGVHTTPRLTVWRYLHLEVDSMGAILGNNVTGTIQSVVPDSNPAYSKVTIDKSLTTGPLVDSPNRFEGGTLTSGGNVFPVISSGSTTVIVQNLPMGVKPIAGSAYILHDDDNVALEANPPEPSLGLISLYNTIFVEPVEIGSRERNNLASMVNVPGSGPDFGNQVNLQKDVQSASSFWVAYVMGAFQGDKNEDNDPFTEPSTNGATVKGLGSLIYLETIRDDSAENNYNALSLEKQVVVHEIGHQFTHTSGWHATAGIMKAQLSGNPQDVFFDEETQKLFRTTIKVN